MILYYAMGGGLGHLTRGRRVLERLGIEAAFVTASPYARDPRVTGGFPVIEVPAQLEHDADAHRAWIRSLKAERILVDSFPGGIQGELCGIDDVPMDYVARLLKWSEYRKAVPGKLPQFETTYVVEELTHEVSGKTVPLNLAEWRDGLSARPKGDDDGLRARRSIVIHSGPDKEVNELLAYAEDLGYRDPTVITRCETYPATSLFENASHIISAAGFNVMLETEPFRHKHSVLPFPRRFDDQYTRAARRKAAVTDL
ncbi:MAG: hypothetical protein ACLGH0_12185 [Thermoanaerobaculia bacterium]